MYTLVIERLDGSTYYQPIQDVFDAIELLDVLGSDYWIIEIF